MSNEENGTRVEAQGLRELVVYYSWITRLVAFFSFGHILASASYAFAN